MIESTSNNTEGKMRTSSLKMTMISVTGIAMLLCSLPGSSSAQNAASPPKFTGPIPSTKDNYAFLSANRVQALVDLQKAGYVEEEYIVSGAANVYEWLPDGSVKVKTPNAPYVTRILVRRPAEDGRFSGNVILETFDNARSFDWSFMWGIS